MTFYTSLDSREEEIRLLRVDLSGNAQHELVSNVALRFKRQRYQALSYTWGDEDEKVVISVNQQEFPISHNLNEALNSVRAFWQHTYTTNGKPLLLWCDQICINQSSTEEKNRQVAYMSEIYRRAECVLVWLPLPVSVNAGFSDWSKWKSWHERQAKASNLQLAYTSPDPMEYGPEQPSSSQSLIAAWKNVRDIVESRWWSRAWVYQEFLLATRTTFLIAGLVAPWTELRDVLDAFVSNVQLHADALDAAVSSLDKNAHKLELDAIGQAHERQGVDEKVQKSSEGCGATCQSWHVKHRQSMQTSCDPCQKGSLFEKIHDHTCGAKAEEEGGDDEACVKICCAVSFCHFWCPVAALEWLLVATVTPLCYVFTWGPWSMGNEAKLAKKRDALDGQEGENRRSAAEMRRLAADRLAPHATSLSTVTQAWNIAQAMIASKAQIADSSVVPPLSKLMRHARNCQCHDPRDKVFAFLGVAGPSYGLVADYGKHNTLHDVVTKATAAVIATEQSLNILHDAKEESEISKVVDHLPSWVPNFTTPDHVNVEYEKFIQGIRLPTSGLSASQHRRAMVSFRADRHGNPDRILQARGIRVGRLVSIVQDPVYEPWRCFVDEEGRKIATRNDARPGDEIWVLFGADVPFALTKPSPQDDSYEILGQAMIWEDGKPSPILYGSLIDQMDRGEVLDEEVSLV